MLWRMGVLLTMSSLTACVASSGDLTLGVMSFNLRYGTADDGPNSWQHRKDILVAAIAHYAPDIVGTQECLEFQADYIAGKLPEYRWFGVGRETDGGGEHAAVLYRKDVLAPVESGNFWLSEQPNMPGSRSWNTACTRMVTWAKFYHIKSKTFFHFFNTHLDHRSEQARVESAKLLAVRAGELAHGLPIIITGDFNADAEKSAAWQTLTQAGFRDAWTSAATRNGPAVTFGGFKAPDAGAEGRIDWILVNGPAQSTECETVLFNQDGRYPSDHFPVFARVTIAGP